MPTKRLHRQVRRLVSITRDADAPIGNSEYNFVLWQLCHIARLYTLAPRCALTDHEPITPRRISADGEQRRGKYAMKPIRMEMHRSEAACDSLLQ